jgi:hypothetical protein
MTILMSVLVLHASASPLPQVPLGKIETPLQCRIMVAGISKSDDITICRTKAAWRELESCRGPTRYCSPEQKAALRAKHTAFSMSEDSRIICRLMSATGSRLRTQQTCMPQREWRRMWDDSSAGVRKMQDQSTRPQDTQ